VPFHNYYLGVHWGDASNWRAAAVSAGVMVDKTPTRGSVAWWAAGSAGSSRGHVAWVQRVTDSAITIEEYNYLSRGMYDTRTIQRSSSLWPSGFIHVGQAVKLRNTARPSVSGTPQVGQRLTSTRGSWSMTGVQVDYQWLADGVPIERGTRKGLFLTAEEQGAKISVRLTATKSGQRAVRAASIPTARTARGVFAVNQKPLMSGTAQVGQTLTIDKGDWSPAPTYRYRWFANGQRIRGANQATFTVPASQLGKAIRAEVVAFRDGFKNGVATTATTAKVVPGTFVNSVRPSIQGTPQVNVPLTAVPGTWSPRGHYAYQWFADGVPIAKRGTKSTFTPRPVELGAVLTVRVTATRNGYTTAQATSVNSSRVAHGSFLLSRPPAIRGKAQVGVRLAADPGLWSPKARLSYQWLLNGAPVAGATGTTFTPTAGMLHQRIALQVTARRHGFLTSIVTTDPTAAVRLGRIANTALPTVSGSAIFGHTLRATAGSWSVDGVTVTYQWLRDGAEIRGATERTYTTRRADRGHHVWVRVTVVTDGYHAASKRSAGVGILFGRVEILERPTIAGEPVVGSRLVASPGRFKPADAKVTYQWFRDDRAISGATKRAYEPTKRDVAARLYVVVTVQTENWAPATRRSLRTHAIRAG
jgi:hypothetical protein